MTATPKTTSIAVSSTIVAAIVTTPSRAWHALLHDADSERFANAGRQTPRWRQPSPTNAPRVVRNPRPDPACAVTKDPVPRARFGQELSDVQGEGDRERAERDAGRCSPR